MMNLQHGVAAYGTHVHPDRASMQGRAGYQAAWFASSEAQHGSLCTVVLSHFLMPPNPGVENPRGAADTNRWQG